MIVDRVIEQLRNEWHELFTCTFPGKILYRTSYKDIRSLVYFYTKESRKPFAVAKIATLPRLYKSLRNEFDTLVSLYTSKDRSCLTNSPRPLFKVECDEGAAIVMSFIDGQGIDSYCAGWLGLGLTRDKLAKKVFLKVLDWWKLFSVQAPVWSGTASGLLVEKYERIKELFSTSYPEDGRLYDELCRLENGLLSIADKVKIGVVHGDLWKGNILVDKEGSIHVIDWERSNNCSVLANDMFLFLTTYYARGDNYTDMVANFIDGSNKNYVIRRAINLISEYVDLSVLELRILYELFLFEMSVQNLIHYGKLTKYDIDWKNRLEFFLDNKAKIFNGSF